MKKAGFILRLIQAILYTVGTVACIIACLISNFSPPQSIIDKISERYDTVTKDNITYDVRLSDNTFSMYELRDAFDYEYFTNNEQYSNVIFTHYLRVKEVDNPYLGINVTYIKDNAEVSENFIFELYADYPNAQTITFKNADNGKVVELRYDDIEEHGFMHIDGQRFAAVLFGFMGVLMALSAALQYVFAFKGRSLVGANLCSIVYNFMFIIGLVGLIGGIIGLIGLKQKTA